MVSGEQWLGGVSQQAGKAEAFLCLLSVESTSPSPSPSPSVSPSVFPSASLTASVFVSVSVSAFASSLVCMLTAEAASSAIFLQHPGQT